MNNKPSYAIPSTQQIITEALALGKTPAKYAVELGAEPETLPLQLWPEIKTESFEKDGFRDVQLCGERQDMFTKFIVNLADSVKFPRSTAFLHGLGVVASAMTLRFGFRYNGEVQPVNLYTLCAQPPSSGKTPINSALTEPVSAAFDFINAETMKVRAKKMMQKDKLKDELKASKNPREIEALTNDLADIDEWLSNNPVYSIFEQNATAEALEKKALEQQKGFFSVVSDEGGGFKTLLGFQGDDLKATNPDIILKAFDNGRVNTSRVGRGNVSGRVRGSIAVIAQAMVIDAIIDAGANDTGLAERFLMLRERPMIGFRDWSVSVERDPSLSKKYSDLIWRIVVRDGDVTLSIARDAIDFINSVRAGYEPQLAQGKKYDHNLLRGVIGKLDKQVYRIACVLHVLEKWSDGEEPLTVGLDTVMWAYSIYDELLKEYIFSVSVSGVAGNDAYVEKVISVIERKLERGNRMPASRKIKVNDLRGLLKNSKPFSGVPNITSTLKDRVFPELEEQGLIVVKDNVIYVSPKL
ncbi:hypothetical protein phiP47_057 [Plesiomonas phage phiP4-7]|nr:hypothetical protein phiP47_057 [Plesiomonas phage phiP4-7]